MKMDLNDKNILIVRLGKIGDVIIASSVFEVLKKRFPSVKITLLTLKRNADVLKYNPKIDAKIFSSKSPSLYFSLFKMRARNFDLLLDLNDDPSRTSMIIRKFLKFRASVGFKFKDSIKPTVAVDQPSKNKTHIIERLNVLLRAINIDPDPLELKPTLYLGEDEELEVDSQLAGFNKFKIAAINISAGAPIRIWNENNYEEIIKAIVNDVTWKTIILHSEEDLKKVKRLHEKFEGDKFIIMKYHSFQHFASYIRHANLLITPDTSAVHVASAFNIPVIALYPGVEWNFASWQPLSDLKRSLLSESESINGISALEVISAFDSIKKEIN